MRYKFCVQFNAEFPSLVMNFPKKLKKNGKGPMTGGEGEKVTC